MSLAHITLATRDVAATRAFFEAVFGWKALSRPGNIDARAEWLAVAPGQEIHLLEVPDFEPSPFEREYGRHVAFFRPRAEFEGLKERLVAHGAELIAPLRPTPFERFFFRSPDGYIFEIIDADDHEE